MTTERDSQLLPSKLMRQWRPESYSDTDDRVSYLLDSKLFEYCLDSITSRNEMHDFEVFCRKLCERTICPNLMPSTGPEGGGDSKADTETYPVADEIAELTYVGNMEASQERWAFAFSAKKTWASKIRSDVAGIIATERGYKKIICITAQFAPAKKRASLEDELTKKYGTRVTILDRSWIVEQVIERSHQDLAHHYLHLGTEVVDSRRLGPNDYSRSRQLSEIEERIARPEAFAGMETQLATEALVAVELSRTLERPRIETEGRIERAIRLAEKYGTYRQKLEAHYSKLWTAFWWFDDIDALNDGYSAFEQMILDTDHAKNLEFLLNLAQLLFSSVIHGHLTLEQAQLELRAERLRDRFITMAAELDRPNHSLEARASLLLLSVNRAMFEHDTAQLSSLWPAFSDVLTEARGLGEFGAHRFQQMIEAFGYAVADDPGYAALVDQLATFVAERTGEAQGALILLKRAKRLDFKDNFEMIRLLGKAARQLSKKEYAEPLIEAATLLALAYRSAGLLWASRASCIFAIASIFVLAEEENDIPASILPTLMILAWVTAELRHLPELLETVRLMQGCIAALPFDEPSQKHIAEGLVALDIFLGGQLLNSDEAELRNVTHMPEILERLGLVHSRNALLYILGHEAKLRAEGSIPDDQTPDTVADIFNKIASQPHISSADYPLLCNGGQSQHFATRVQGVRIAIDHRCTDVSISTAETIVGVVEAVFATVMALKIGAHTERFTVVLRESAQITLPEFSINADDMTATVKWPNALTVGSHEHSKDIQRTFVGLAASILTATCHVPDIQATLQKLFETESLSDRVALIVAASNSRQRLFNEGHSKMSAWAQMADTEFSLEEHRPTIQRVQINRGGDEDINEDRNSRLPDALRDHRRIAVLSVIDVHLWERAGWHGAAFLGFAPGTPPALALLFADKDAARKIFLHWRERFGPEDREEQIYLALVRGISQEYPAHYRTLISSRYPTSSDDASDDTTYNMVSRMMTMEASSEGNLNRFLTEYQHVGAYFLTPAIMVNGKPELLPDLAILKRVLVVRKASEIGEHDPEAIALGKDLFQQRFGRTVAGDDPDHD